MTAEWSLRESDLRTLAAPPALPAVLPGSGFVDPVSSDIVLTHLDNVLPALDSLRSQSSRLAAWGVELAQRLLRGQRLLAAGNGGSAAEAQHLTAELVGRFDGERVPFSAISLHAESSAVTAIANDYGFDDVFAQQVGALAARGQQHKDVSGPAMRAHLPREDVVVAVVVGDRRDGG